jgi:type II/III secretion system protein
MPLIRRLVAASLVALLGGRLAEAQARRSYSIDSLLHSSEPRTPDAEAKLSPIETWLEINLPKRCGGVQRVEFRRTTERTYSSASSGATSSTSLEITGVGDFSEQVTSVLAGLAAQAGRTVSVEARVVEGKRPATHQLQTPTVDFLSPAEAEALARGFADDSEHEVLSAPRIVVFQGQEAALSIGREISYIKDWQLADGGDQMIAEPEVAVLFEGLKVNLAPVVHPDGKAMTLSMDVSIANLERPIRKVDVVLAGKTTQRDVPEIQTMQWTSGQLELPEDVRRFRVRGLWRRDPASGIAHDIDVLVSVDVSADSAEGRAGTVLAVDADAKRVVVEAPESARDLRPGSRLHVLRNDAPIATIVVDRIEGALLVTHVVDGEAPAAGDAVR